MTGIIDGSSFGAMDNSGSRLWSEEPAESSLDLVGSSLNADAGTIRLPLRRSGQQINSTLQLERCMSHLEEYVSGASFSESHMRQAVEKVGRIASEWERQYSTERRQREASEAAYEILMEEAVKLGTNASAERARAALTEAALEQATEESMRLAVRAQELNKTASEERARADGLERQLEREKSRAGSDRQERGNIERLRPLATLASMDQGDGYVDKRGYVGATRQNVTHGKGRFNSTEHVRDSILLPTSAGSSPAFGDAGNIWHVPAGARGAFLGMSGSSLFGWEASGLGLVVGRDIIHGVVWFTWCCISLVARFALVAGFMLLLRYVLIRSRAAKLAIVAIFAWWSRTREIREAKGRVAIRAVVRGCGAFVECHLRRSARLAASAAARLSGGPCGGLSDQSHQTNFDFDMFEVRSQVEGSKWITSPAR